MDHAKFMELVHRAIKGGAACTCRELLNLTTDEEKGELDRLQDLIEMLNKYRLVTKPLLNVGGFDDERVLMSAGPSDVLTEDEVMTMIRRGETPNVEFKSTLLTDLRRLRRTPGLPDQDYHSDAVLHSALKTICGMLNANGGWIFLGVEDDASICGIETDFARLHPGRQNLDGWLLRIVEIVRTKFVDGSDICNFLDFRPVEIAGNNVVRIGVIRRNRETYLNCGGNSVHMYMRYGTRTDKIEYHEVADFIRERDRANAGYRYIQ